MKAEEVIHGLRARQVWEGKLLILPENSEARHLKNNPRTWSYFSFPHPAPNPMHCMCNIYLNTRLLSIQEIHQWPQDIICVLCNCVSGISSNISRPFHLTEDIRHLLDTLINTSLKAEEIGEAKTRLSVAEISDLVYKVKYCKSINYALNYTLFLHEICCSFPYCICY